MNYDKIILKVRNFACDNSEKDDIHGFAHVERVLKTCIEIGTNLNANLFVLKTAALLHDVGRYLNKEIKNKNHAEISSEIAKNFIVKNSYDIGAEDLENILHCIRSHSFSNDVKPNTLEARILHDADKLDALGAIGLYRTIGFTLKSQGEIEQVIDHLEKKILKLKDMLYLEYSKNLAERRHKLVLEFYDQILKELR